MSGVSLAQVLERIFLPQPLDTQALEAMSEQEVEMALRAYGVDPQDVYALALPTVAGLDAHRARAQLRSLGADVDGYLARAAQLMDGHAGASRPRGVRWARALAASVLVVVSATVGLMVVEQELLWREAPSPQPVSTEARARRDPSAPRPDPASPAAVMPVAGEGGLETVSESPRQAAGESTITRGAGSSAPPASETAAVSRTRPARERAREAAIRATAIPPALPASLHETPGRGEGPTAAIARDAPRPPGALTQAAGSDPPGTTARAVPSTPAASAPAPPVEPMESSKRRAAPEPARQRLRPAPETGSVRGSPAIAALKKSASGLLGQDAFEDQAAGASRGPDTPATRNSLTTHLRAAGLSPVDEQAVLEALRARRFIPRGLPRIERSERGETLLTFTASDGTRLRLVREREGRWWDLARRKELSQGER